MVRTLIPMLAAAALISCGTPRAATVALPDFASLVEKEGPAVVNVITTGSARQAAPDPFELFRRFMPDLPAPPQQQWRAQGLGSGFIISADGYILTNAHVVEGAAKVTVRLADAKREFDAKVVGADKRTDVALLKVDANGLPTVEIGDSSKLKPGEWVLAIGSPFGFANTVTAGIVSATERALPAETYVPFIQTDVAVNPGNSGGPLLNLQGEVVGINSQIYSRTGGYMGVSFAIPIEAAMQVARQLREHGKVTRGRLGIGIQPLTRELAESFGLDEAKGVLVGSVDPGAPAAAAGLEAGDVILAYNGEPIDEANELPRLVAGTRPGSKATLEIWRKGKKRTLETAVGEFESSAAAQPQDGSGVPADLGLAVRELTAQEKKQLGVAYGLAVVDVRSGAAAASGLRRGDVIVAVNQNRFSSIAEFNRLVGKGDASVALLVRRGQAAFFVPVPVG